MSIFIVRKPKSGSSYYRHTYSYLFESYLFICEYVCICWSIAKKTALGFVLFSTPDRH